MQPGQLGVIGQQIEAGTGQAMDRRERIARAPGPAQRRAVGAQGRGGERVAAGALQGSPRVRRDGRPAQRRVERRAQLAGALERAGLALVDGPATPTRRAKVTRSAGAASTSASTGRPEGGAYTVLTRSRAG